MRFSFFIIDDDPSSRKMLHNIIENEDLGDIAGEADDGFGVESSIMVRKCDIVLVDLLMPKQDGIETVVRLKDMGYKGKYVMISQVEHKEMVAEAYSKGVEYFIHKPINRIEVVAVLRKVMDHITLERSLQGIRNTLAMLDTQPQEQRPVRSDSYIHSVLADLGILGESGSQDLIHLVEFLLERYSKERIKELPALKDIFTDYIRERDKDSSDTDIQREVKAMEQRIRRTVARGLHNLSSLGLEDYGNPKFEMYASKYFDFADVRQKMREIEQNEEVSRIRLNVKKFIFTLYLETKEHA
ncbi:response regulator [Aneurinibacillus tyrosinisolvens]|uniref:response regulator n=1 Tax=Aneurinibacillus tyrosinisolvens TaxID=1443435 RepID=UPI00069BDFC5|nr:response regulator [Aneurinibacillus tyrosinisolvens]